MSHFIYVQEALPPQPLSGMVNKSGGKVRLTFKLENDQLWIGTKERTEKIPMTSIKAVVSEPIERHEQVRYADKSIRPTVSPSRTQSNDYQPQLLPVS